MPLLIAAALCALPLRVTIHARAQPLHLLLPTLSAQTGRRLTVDKPLAGEWLVIEAKDVDPDALLGRIAEVTHAEWSQDPSGRYRLSRTPARERALADEEQSFIVREILRKFAPRSTPYDPQRAAERMNRAISQRQRSDDPKDYGEYMAAQLDAPAYHGLCALVPLLPLGEISRIQSPESLVFASHPSGSQQPLPPGATAILKRLSRDWDRYRSHLTETDSSTTFDTSTQATLKVEPRSTLLGAFVFSFSLSEIARARQSWEHHKASSAHPLNFRFSPRKTQRLSNRAPFRTN
jgi:hypothetical protein